jgi:hypothetical protein
MKNFLRKAALFIIIPFAIGVVVGCKKSTITTFPYAGGAYYLTKSEATTDGKTWGVQSLTLCAASLRLTFNTDGTYADMEESCRDTKFGTYKYDQNTKRLTLTPGGAQAPDYDGIVESTTITGFILDQFAVQGANANNRLTFSRPGIE